MYMYLKKAWYLMIKTYIYNIGSIDFEELH